MIHNIPLTVARLNASDGPKMTTSAAFPPSFIALKDEVKVVAVGAIAENISALCRAESVRTLSSIPESVSLNLQVDIGPDGIPAEAGIDWPESVALDHREAITMSIGVGMYQYAIEFARRQSSQEVSGD